MFLRYGSYQHDTNEAYPAGFTQTVQYSNRGRAQLVRKTMQVEGVIIPSAASQSNITAALREFESAYARGLSLSQTVGFYQDDGTPTPHVLPATGALGGVRILSIDYPRADRAEYATQRTFRVVLQADYRASTDDLVSWQETIRIIGDGGPAEVLQLLANGVPQRQTVAQRTPVFAQQTGRAVGYLAYPSFPQPIWPFAIDRPRIEQVMEAPQLQRSSFVNYGIAWNYPYQSETPLVGRPTAR